MRINKKNSDKKNKTREKQQIYFCLQHADKVTNVKSPKKQQKDSIEFQKYDSDLVSQLKSKKNNKKKLSNSVKRQKITYNLPSVRRKKG